MKQVYKYISWKIFATTEIFVGVLLFPFFLIFYLDDFRPPKYNNAWQKNYKYT